MKLRAMILMLLLAVAPARAVAPVVENVVAAQRDDGSMLVEIRYDLVDADGDTCRVSIAASDDDGLTWAYPATTLSGDAGDGVTPGPNKTAVWDFGHDHAGAWGDGYRVQVIASDLGFDWRPHSPARYAAHHWGPPSWDAATLPERFARADVLTLTAQVFWDNGPYEALGIVDAIHAVNPDCTVLGYVPVHGIPHFYGTEPEGSFAKRLYDATLPYWSYTTTGDTLSSWPAVVEVNILDPACRDALVSTYVDYYAASGTKFDGIFYDYFPDAVWIPTFVGCEGEADLDQDGIPQQSDPDEMAAYDAAQESLVLEMRTAMGGAFPLVFNGVRAQRDSAFAALGDGINYEIFPTLKFAAPRIGTALDPDVAHSLWHTSAWPRTQAGGPYILLENIQRYNILDHEGEIYRLESGNLFRVIGLLIDDVYAVWEPSGLHNFGWPEQSISLGAPLGPATVDGDVYTRAFTYGDVWMELKDGGVWPNPFRYRITIGDRIVEELDSPYHYP